MSKTREWLVLNAVISWLYHYTDQDEAQALKLEYKMLKKELEQEIINNYEQSKNTTSKKRGRPAKRQRTQKTASTEVSETKSKDA